MRSKVNYSKRNIIALQHYPAVIQQLHPARKAATVFFVESGHFNIYFWYTIVNWKLLHQQARFELWRQNISYVILKMMEIDQDSPVDREGIERHVFIRLGIVVV